MLVRNKEKRGLYSCRGKTTSLVEGCLSGQGWRHFWQKEYEVEKYMGQNCSEKSKVYIVTGVQRAQGEVWEWTLHVKVGVLPHPVTIKRGKYQVKENNLYAYVPECLAVSEHKTDAYIKYELALFKYSSCKSQVPLRLHIIWYIICIWHKWSSLYAFFTLVPGLYTFLVFLLLHYWLCLILFIFNKLVAKRYWHCPFKKNLP